MNRRLVSGSRCAAELGGSIQRASKERGHDGDR